MKRKSANSDSRSHKLHQLEASGDHALIKLVCKFASQT